MRARLPPHHTDHSLLYSSLQLIDAGRPQAILPTGFKADPQAIAAWLQKVHARYQTLM